MIHYGIKNHKICINIIRFSGYQRFISNVESVLFDGRPKSHQNFVSSLQFHVMLKVEVEVRDLAVFLVRDSELHIIHEVSLLVIAGCRPPHSSAPG